MAEGNSEAESQKTITIRLPGIPKVSPWMVTTALLLIACLVLFLQPEITGMFGISTTGGLTPEQAANEAIAWISNYYKSGGADTTVTLVSAKKTESGIIEFTIKLSGADGEQTQTLYVTEDGKLFLPDVIPTEEIIATTTTQPQEQPSEGEYTIGNFIEVAESEVCKEDGKPIIYFFGSSGCGYCKWEHPIFENVTSKFAGHISFHNNMDTDDDAEIFSKYNPRRSIPTMVLGCKYYRVGSGASAGEEQEVKVLTALICKLTDNQPTDVCSAVEDMINQI